MGPIMMMSTNVQTPSTEIDAQFKRQAMEECVYSIILHPSSQTLLMQRLKGRQWMNMCLLKYLTTFIIDAIDAQIKSQMMEEYVSIQVSYIPHYRCKSILHNIMGSHPLPTMGSTKKSVFPQGPKVCYKYHVTNQRLKDRRGPTKCIA